MLGYVFRSYQQRHKMYWALDAAHSTLEERVKRRTAELEKANLELVREISERKEAQRKIYQQAQVLSSIKDSIFIISSDMKILYANQTACDTFGQFLGDSSEPPTCYEVSKKTGPDLSGMPRAESIGNHATPQVGYKLLRP